MTWIVTTPDLRITMDRDSANKWATAIWERYGESKRLAPEHLIRDMEWEDVSEEEYLREARKRSWVYTHWGRAYVVMYEEYTTPLDHTYTTIEVFKDWAVGLRVTKLPRNGGSPVTTLRFAAKRCHHEMDEVVDLGATGVARRCTKCQFLSTATPSTIGD